MKCIKSITTLLLALTMIFAMALPSFAVTPDSMYADGANSYYIQGSEASYEVDGEITVYLYLYSGTYDVSSSVTKGPIDTMITVTLGTPSSTDTAYTVSDVLAAAQLQQSDISFDVTLYDPLGMHSNLMRAVKSTSVDPNFWFEAAKLYYTTGEYYCGWMFRINGNLPSYYEYNTQTSSWDLLAYDIAHSYVSDGDVINFYYCNVLNQNFATKPRAFIYDNNSTSVYNSTTQKYDVTLRALQCECYTNDPTVLWTNVAWSPLANKSFDVIVDGVQQSTSTNASGYCTISVDSQGSHTILFKTTRKAFKVNSNTSFPKYNVPKELGLYCTFSN